MHAVVLCPGESLRLMDRLPQCDMSIGVNRAALAFRVDWFAASDYPMIRNHIESLPGTPSLLTLRQTEIDLRNRLSRFPRVCIAESLPCPLKHPKTMMLAVLLAFSLGATTIDVYGADWTGTRDYDGVEAGENRTPDRWDAERHDWDILTAWLNERGVIARRV